METPYVVLYDSILRKILAIKRKLITFCVRRGKTYWITVILILKWGLPHLTLGPLNFLVLLNKMITGIK